jgi:hypothetical protein
MGSARLCRQLLCPILRPHFPCRPRYEPGRHPRWPSLKVILKHNCVVCRLIATAQGLFRVGAQVKRRHRAKQGATLDLVQNHLDCMRCYCKFVAYTMGESAGVFAANADLWELPSFAMTSIAFRHLKSEPDVSSACYGRGPSRPEQPGIHADRGETRHQRPSGRNGSLAKQAIAAALAYCAQSPVILGMMGASLGGRTRQRRLRRRESSGCRV